MFAGYLGKNLCNLVQWEWPVWSKGKVNKYSFKIPTTIICLSYEIQQWIFPSVRFWSSTKGLQKLNVLDLASRDYMWLCDSLCTGNKTCFAFQCGRQRRNITCVGATLGVGFSFLIMPMMNCRKPYPGIAIISYNRSFWLGSPSRLYSVAQTRGCVNDIVYAFLVLFVIDQMKLFKLFFLAMKTEFVILIKSSRLLCVILARDFSQARLVHWVMVWDLHELCHDI